MNGRYKSVGNQAAEEWTSDTDAWMKQLMPINSDFSAMPELTLCSQQWTTVIINKQLPSFSINSSSYIIWPSCSMFTYSTVLYIFSSFVYLRTFSQSIKTQLTEDVAYLSRLRCCCWSVEPLKIKAPLSNGYKLPKIIWQPGSIQGLSALRNSPSVTHTHTHT